MNVASAVYFTFEQGVLCIRIVHVLIRIVRTNRFGDYLSRGINIPVEHARTAYRKTCRTEYQQPYRTYISQTPYYKWNIAQARPMSVSDISRSLQS